MNQTSSTAHDIAPGLLIEYREAPLASVSLITSWPSFLRTVPDRKPRTLWACQPVSLQSPSRLAPDLRRRARKTRSDLLREFLFGSGLPDVAAFGEPDAVTEWVFMTTSVGLASVDPMPAPPQARTPAGVRACQWRSAEPASSPAC